MKLSTKGRYGLRAILEIALNSQDRPVTTANIARNQGISERYLEQLLTPLKKAGYIKSVRGYQGGYVLRKDSRDITVGDIIRVLEGPVFPVECVSQVDPEDCRRATHCVTRKIWSQLRDSINQVLDSHTLEDLVEQVGQAGEGQGQG